ncbi:hypothetical protein WJX73_007342 [Symbiochloris irregularis]|uniref:CBF1-interacting co-repressor CIR N-terminal domain-containing protein n=1 Tax=Symbiochloris irregularis TaxID=706552 RepID=A0AAW1P6R2_9CHLO
MGGHGGLNILPQKSWNVYGRENRLKVARDQAAHAEVEAARLAKHQQAEGQRRRLQLLDRARQRAGIDRSELPDSASILPVAQQPTQEDEEVAKPFTLFPDTSLEQNPEIVEEKRHESRARGSEATRTSDARFDAAFKFAHTVGGKQPWHVKPQNVLGNLTYSAATSRMVPAQHTARNITAPSITRRHGANLARETQQWMQLLSARPEDRTR